VDGVPARPPSETGRGRELSSGSAGATSSRRGPGEDTRYERRGRLRARPGPDPADAPRPGQHPLAISAGRDAIVYAPATHLGRPLPLVVAFHGAGGDGPGGMAPLIGLADRYGFLLLAPESRQRTWDVLVGGYGPDVDYIDRALAHVFATYAVDRTRVVAAGFSDGASYALSLGLTNGDLFASVMAFSPGFASPGRSHGSPRLFLSHGTRDTVLPIDRTSRRLAPRLRRSGYDVWYREFDGGHTVPPEIARAAVEWAALGPG
jgi:phospholipase/carboxylesterase